MDHFAPSCWGYRTGALDTAGCHKTSSFISSGSSHKFFSLSYSYCEAKGQAKWKRCFWAPFSCSWQLAALWLFRHYSSGCGNAASGTVAGIVVLANHGYWMFSWITQQELLGGWGAPALIGWRLWLVLFCFWLPPAVFTFPEDWIPLIMAKPTMLQAMSRHIVILQLSPPLSEMLSEMSRASRYQKKVVAELFSHSGSTTEK